jgi:sulfoxide reductase catalytic subunit YedY
MMTKIPSSEITPESVYFNRRAFMKTAGALLAGSVLAACAPQLAAQVEPTATPTLLPPSNLGIADDLGDPATPFDTVTHYNNYYEFTTSKEGVASLAQNLRTDPWTLEVAGLVRNPGAYAVDDLIARFTPEERIYRLRCVEGWSMVIPWQGFPLAKLLREAEPMTSARFVKFTTLYAPEQMRGQADRFYSWPYIEGLRLDEAENDLAILATGLYGQPLPRQDGAPIRLVVPWKYGFKSIKAITRIELVEEQPVSFWMNAAPDEYGFYSNVNPYVAHPRWSQASERRLGELGRRPTLQFNGYADEVGQLYAGMDLAVNY